MLSIGIFMTRFSRTALRLNLPLQVPRTRPRRIAHRADWTRKIPEAGKARRKPTFQPKSAIRLRAEADKMPESTIAAIGNAPASLMTDLGPIPDAGIPAKNAFHAEAGNRAQPLPASGPPCSRFAGQSLSSRPRTRTWQALSK